MEYLFRSQLKPQKAEFNEMLVQVRKKLKEKGIFFGPPKLVGSSKRNLVFKGNNGYDLDYQLRLGNTPDGYTAKKIKKCFKKAFDEEAETRGLKPCEDSTHVLTIKKLENKKIVYSYDVAILEKNSINKYMILKNEKKSNSEEDYHFNELKDCVDLDSLFKKIKGKGQWDLLREKYKDKKSEWQNVLKDDRPASISLLMQAVNEVLQKI